MKHIQHYMNYFQLDFRRFERQPQSEQFSIIFTPPMELIFETTDTDDIEMNPSHSMIDPIVIRNFGNKFHHKNGPNQCQHINKKPSRQYHHIITRRQYKNRNTGKQHQHRHPSQQYQPISFQKNRTSSITYLKENWCGINNKGVIELLMKHDGTLENPSFRGSLYIHAKAPR